MKKVLGLALAMTLTFAMSAVAAQETQGQIMSIDRAGQSFTLADGTELSLAAQQLSELAPGGRKARRGTRRASSCAGTRGRGRSGPGRESRGWRRR